MAFGTVTREGGSNGFFSIISDVLTPAAEGVGQGLRQGLPIWTANQLDLTSRDLAASTTFQRAFAGPTLRSSPTATPSTAPQAGPLKAFFDNINIGSDAFLVTGVAIIGIILLVQFARK